MKFGEFANRAFGHIPGYSENALCVGCLTPLADCSCGGRERFLLEILELASLPKDGIALIWVDREGRPKGVRIVNLGSERK